MSLGMITDILAIIIGGTLGATGGKLMPERFKDALPPTFAIATFAMAILSIIKMANLPVVVLALILGVLIGTACHLEKLLRHAGEWTAAFLLGRTGGSRAASARHTAHGGHSAAATQSARISQAIRPDPTARARNLEFFAIAVILFCTGPTGIFGAMQATVTGDNTLLFSKTVLDIFTAFVFAANAGIIIALLAAPMFLAYLILALFSGSIAPLLTPEMIADFSGCGGLLILATGFRMAEIKMFRVTDMLPALVLVMPISYLWQFI
ncbi:MAG: DUF554 domain-containing protein [Planctomycetes bacterium]|nr:DUF554 domain-containing protein [Planctomycetota bacterium]